MESGSNSVILSGRSAVWNPDWLPEGQFPALDALRAEHRRLLGLYADLTAEATALHERFDGEGAAREKARQAEVAGSRAAMPKATPEAERDAAFAEVAERSQSVADALLTLGREVLDVAEQSADEWLGELIGKDAAHLAEIEELRAKIAEQEAAIAESRRLVMWVGRTSGRRWRALAARLVPFPSTPVPPASEDFDATVFMKRPAEVLDARGAADEIEEALTNA
jgi:hypothetical protein